MDQKKGSLKELIERNVLELTQTKSFTDWFAKQKIKDDDMIVLNNSFIFRKEISKRSSKNNRFLAIQVNQQRLDFNNIIVVTPSNFNEDFKLISSKDISNLDTKSLASAIENEYIKAGQLVFFLIGELIENQSSVLIQNKEINELRFDPKCESPDIIKEDGRYIFLIRELKDPEGNWNLALSKIAAIMDGENESFRRNYLIAFEKLRSEVKYQMVLPGSTTEKNENTFIFSLIKSIEGQRILYDSSLEKFRRGEDEEANYRELLRISYNFAGDAIRIIHLLVSICDLKPIILWATINAHYDLAEKFRNMPVIRSEYKGNTDEYIKIVNGARNHAFHNLLAFDRTIEADLQGIQMKARKLTLMPAYNQRKTAIAFDYEEREMVEILKEFTRAEETLVPGEFWERNGNLMRSFEVLLKSTEKAMWSINRARE